MSYYPKRFAHRGLCQHAPENTLGAFVAAVACGCEGIELDIHLTKDGIPVVIHDEAPFRLTDGAVSAWVHDMTLEELSEITLPYAAHLLPHGAPVPYPKDEGSVAHYKKAEVEKMRREDKRFARIPTFEEFDRWFEGVKEDVTVEIEFCETGLTESMYEILSRSKNVSRYILFSGNRQTNDEIQSCMREKGKPEGLRLGANVRRLTDETLEFIRNADLYEVGLNDGWFTSEDVKMLDKMGIKVFSNLGDYPEWWSEIQKNGVYAFKTNYAEAYTEWLEANG